MFFVVLGCFMLIQVVHVVFGLFYVCVLVVLGCSLFIFFTRCFTLFGLFQVTRVCLFLMVGFNWFQMVLGCFDWCLVVLGDSGCFRKFTKLPRVVVCCFIMFQFVSICFKSCIVLREN